jgi:hypothetical protein
MRAVGEPTGSRRLTDEPDTDDDARTSPFPYADDFDEWVADETAAPERPQRHRDTAPAARLPSADSGIPRTSTKEEQSGMSEQQSEQPAERDPESDDRDAQERDSSAGEAEGRDLGPIEDADEWGKDVPERGHGDDIA